MENRCIWQRNRRLSPEEELRVVRVLNGEVVGNMSAAEAPAPAMLMLFRLILATGLRLQEAYTLRVGQVDFERGLISVDGSKGHRGVIKPRSVPMLPSLAAQSQSCARHGAHDPGSGAEPALS